VTDSKQDIATFDYKEIEAHQTVVLQSRVRIRRLPSPQLTANLLVGCHLEMALGCGLTSVRGNRGKNYENEPLVPQKHTKKKKERNRMMQEESVRQVAFI
jgi:hypothetical protein